MDLLALYNVDLRVCAIWPMLRGTLYTFFLGDLKRQNPRAAFFSSDLLLCVCFCGSLTGW